MFPHKESGYIPSKDFRTAVYETNIKYALGSFNSSYEKVFPQIMEDDHTSPDIKLLILDQYLGFVARNHFEKYYGQKVDARLTAESFLYPDIELLKPNWLPSAEEKIIIDELSDLRIRLTHKLRFMANNVRFLTIENKIETHLKISGKTSRRVLNDPFFPIPFKFFFKNLAVSQYLSSDKELAEKISKIEITDFGKQLFEDSNYKEKAVNNPAWVQSKKDILVAYFFVCLKYLREEHGDELNSGCIYENVVLDATIELCHIYHPEHPEKYTRESLKSIIRNFENAKE